MYGVGEACVCGGTPNGRLAARGGYLRVRHEAAGQGLCSVGTGLGKKCMLRGHARRGLRTRPEHMQIDIERPSLLEPTFLFFWQPRPQAQHAPHAPHPPLEARPGGPPCVLRSLCTFPGTFCMSCGSLSLLLVERVLA